VFAGLISAQALIPYALDDWFGLNGNWFLLFGGLILIFTLLRNPEGVAGDFYRRTHKRQAFREPAATTEVTAKERGAAPRASPADLAGRAGSGGDDAAGLAACDGGPTPPRAFGDGAAVLRISGLSVRFGGVHALSDVSLEVREGELVGLIGPNGAGKTALVDAASGFVASTGRVELGGTDLGGLEPYERARHGLARTWQSAELGACLRGLADRGQSMLLIEHDMGLVLGICDRVVVLEFGRVIADGPPEVVRTDPLVIAAYLGEGMVSDPAAG
jgi:ABC-type glutathione transport system ATPase component